MQINAYRKSENLHILLWLIKYFCWVTNFRVLGMIMIIPTIGMAIYITWKSREIKSEKLHNLAVVFWIIANSVWMFGEFYLDDSTRPFAIFFFVSGLITVGYHYLISEPFWIKKVDEIDLE